MQWSQEWLSELWLKWSPPPAVPTWRYQRYESQVRSSISFTNIKHVKKIGTKYVEVWVMLSHVWVILIQNRNMTTGNICNVIMTLQLVLHKRWLFPAGHKGRLSNFDYTEQHFWDNIQCTVVLITVICVSRPTKIVTVRTERERERER